MMPAMNEPLFDLTISELCDRMRAGTLSPVTLVEAHIERAEALDRALNIFTRTRFEAARQEARAAEARYRRGEAGPIAGIPLSVKEMVSVGGMPQTAGITARRDVLADRDATVVRRLRRAGGVVLGVTNVPEGGMWVETDNRIYGRTKNPWDPARTPGGSSGGEAALIAAGGAVFGVGSDIGGSIRIPASFCGVPGHKPTGGLVPNTGHWPNDGSAGAMLTTGPFARSVGDLWMLLGLMGGPDGLDWSVDRAPIGVSLDAIEPSRMRALVVQRVAGVRIRPEIKGAIDRAAGALEAAGAQVEALPGDIFDEALQIWAAAMEALESDPFEVLLGDGRPVGLLRELPRLLLRRSGHTTIALAAVTMQRLGALIGRRLARALAAGERLRDRLEALLGPDGVLVGPAYPRPAPRHREPMLRPQEFICSGIFNPLHFPGTVIPVGFSANGLPLSVQIVGARGADHLTLAAAHQIERRLGGWVRAEPLAP